MKLLVATAIFTAALPAGAALAAEDQPPPSPIKRQTAKAAYQRWGYVVMSDKTRHDGLVYTTPGKRIRVLDRKKNVYCDIKWPRIESIAQIPDKEWTEQEWRWLEGGNDAKVFTDRYYAAAKYRTVITLKSGEKIVGDAVAPIYVKVENKLHRLELHKRSKSPKPLPKKDLQPLVYIKALMLTDKEPERKTSGKKSTPKLGK
ncbi:MAG: hypothetical protein ABIF82_10100 [Planctomycetota bacterium]